MVTGVRKERVDFRGKNQHYHGNPRQPFHPFDRKSGTGRGKEMAKGGHGKGNWGDIKDEIVGQLENATTDKPTTELVADEGTERKEGAPEEKTRDEEAKGESPAKEVEEEEETKGLTLEEYMAQKKKPGFKKEARQAETLKKDNIEKVDASKQKVETNPTHIRNQDTYSIATGKTETA